MKNPFPKLPIIFIPRWAMTKWWAISIHDVVKYPVGVLEIPETSGKSFDTGENDILGYYEVLKIRANLLNNKIFIPSIYSWV